MRKYINGKIIGLALIATVLAGCEFYRTAEQEASPIVSPDDKPMATFSSDFTGNTVEEGDTVTYTITFDKIIDRSVTFHVNQTGGAAVEDVDYTYEPATINPYTLET